MKKILSALVVLSFPLLALSQKPDALFSRVLITVCAQDMEYKNSEGMDCSKLQAEEKEFAQQLKKSWDELGKRGQETVDAHPEWKGVLNNEPYVEFKIRQVVDKMDLGLKAFKDKCSAVRTKAKDEKADSVFCVPEEERKANWDGVASWGCLERRKLQVYRSTQAADQKLISQLEENHAQSWKELPEGKGCQTILDKDKEDFKLIAAKAPEAKVDEAKEGPAEKEAASSDDPANINTETCQWVSDLPRKVVSSPGCKTKTTSNGICSGYVTCERKGDGVKFVGLASCSPNYCGPSDAVKCVTQPGFSVLDAKDDPAGTISNKVKEAIGIKGVIKQ